MRDLQAAIESGDFGAIPQLAAAYRNKVLLRLTRTPETAGRRAILQEARETLNYALQLAKLRRAHLAARLKAITMPASPYQTSQPPLHTWRMDG